jgi:hypothetical protein
VRSLHSRSGRKGGMIVTGSPAAFFRRDLIINLAARHRLPAVYLLRTFVTGGGVISYGLIRSRPSAMARQLPPDRRTVKTDP